MSASNARILVIRMSAMGDVVFALPVLEELRSWMPHAHITWLVEDRHASLLRGHPSIDELLVFPRKSGKLAQIRHLRQLRKQKPWDAILDLQSNAKSGLQLLFCKSRRKIGFGKPIAREFSTLFTHETVTVPWRFHHSARNLVMLQQFGWPGKADIPGTTLVSADALRNRWPLPQTLQKEMADAVSGPPPIFLHTTVSPKGLDKDWPANCWAELAQELHKEGHQILLLWTPADLEKVNTIFDLADGTARMAPETPSLQHLMALTDQGKLLIGTDSGPVHLAAKRGLSVLGLYGPTDPARSCPPGPHRIATILPRGETPPKRRRLQPSPLMLNLPVSLVLEQALTMLNSPLNEG
jgi:heptosyltransferase-1